MPPRRLVVALVLSCSILVSVPFSAESAGVRQVTFAVG